MCLGCKSEYSEESVEPTFLYVVQYVTTPCSSGHTSVSTHNTCSDPRYQSFWSTPTVKLDNLDLPTIEGTNEETPFSGADKNCFLDRLQ